MEQPRITQVHPRAGSSPLGPMGPLAHGPLEFKPHLCGDGGRLATEVDAARIGSSRMISGPPPPRPFAAGGRNLVWSWDWLPASRKAPTPWGREPRLERWSWSWASRGGDAENCGAPKKKGHGRRGGKQTQKLSKLFKPFRNATTLLKHFQASSNLFETLQNFSNLLKPFQTFSNLFKPLLAL